MAMVRNVANGFRSGYRNRYVGIVARKMRPYCKMGTGMLIRKHGAVRPQDVIGGISETGRLADER